MLPHDIEKIAQAVSVSLLQQSLPRLPAGCGSISSPQEFSCQSYDCSQNYECGGLGEFTCGQGFSCPEGFLCSCDFTSPVE
jgi:hypothetical protein